MAGRLKIILTISGFASAWLKKNFQLIVDVILQIKLP